MKRNFLIVILAVTFTLCFAAWLTACNLSGTAHRHTWSLAWKKDDTHHWRTCGGCDEISSYEEHDFSNGDCKCGFKKTVEPVEEHKHSWDIEWSKDDTHHWRTCGGCDEISAFEEHDFTYGDCKCGEKKPVEEHKHKWNIEWSKDETYHWLECEGCDEISLYEEHDFTYGDCKCGENKPVEEHKHSWDIEWSKDETHHWLECEGCDEISLYEEHDFTYGDCKCGEKKPVEEHKHSWNIEWSKDETYHWLECEGCDEISEFEEHDFTNGDCKCGKPLPYTAGLDYELNNDNASYSVVGIGEAKTTDIIIPQYYDNKPVTAIGAKAFINCSQLTRVTLPEGILSIGEEAFKECNAINGINFPDSLTSIGDSAFWGCSVLTGITIGAGVTNVGWNAFNGCGKLIVYCEAADKPENWSNEWNRAGRPVIWDCINNNTATDGYTYASFNGLLYALKDGEATVAYQEATVGDEITIPQTVAYNRVNYRVTAISDYAFTNCIALTQINLPDSIASIGDSAFVNTGFYNNSANWERGLLYLGYRLINVKDDISGICNIKSGTRTIENYAFRGCKFTYITMPDSVISVGNAAFYSCSELTGVTLSKGLKSTGIQAFVSCRKLASVTIPEGMTEISNSAFSGCSELESIIIPAGLTRINESAFSSCNKLKAVYFTSRTQSDIAVEQNNIPFNSAAKYYYSAEEPALNSDGTDYAGNFWHYGDDGKTPEIWIKK